MDIVYFLDTLRVQNFAEITLTVKEIEAILCFHTVGKNLPKVSIAYCLDTLGVENFDEIALSPTVKEIQAILCFRTFSTKIRKFKMAAIFENFLKSCHIYFFYTLGVENFDEIALSRTVREI